MNSSSKLNAKKSLGTLKEANASLELLQKLKQARDSGLLSEDEFQEKRKKLLADL